MYLKAHAGILEDLSDVPTPIHIIGLQCFVEAVYHLVELY